MLNNKPNNPLVVTVIMGRMVRVIDLASKASGSKNQISCEEKMAPIRRKIRIEYFSHLIFL